MPVNGKKQSQGRSPSTSVGVSDAASMSNGSAGPWTFLTNHAHVLIVLHSRPDLVLREVASQVGITERAVQRIVQELEEEGYLQRERIGRRNNYHITSGKHLRHPVESHCTIDLLLKLISSKAVSKV